MINWNSFRIKSNGKETYDFEQLSYLLFCAELNNRIGLFRYKNQAGVETNPITIDETTIGFQSKYYGYSGRINKNEIIDSIKKTKRENATITILYLYIDLELSESSIQGQQKPKYQLEIERTAKKLGLGLEWRVPSHFELQLSLPENKYIYDLFFNYWCPIKQE